MNFRIKLRAFACLVLLAGASCPASAELVVQRIYTSPPAAVTLPFSTLVQGVDGNFYGITPGDRTAYGSLFCVYPGGLFSTIAWFRGPPGPSDPNGPLVLAKDGCLYGTSMTGGEHGYGVLFRVTSGGGFQLVHAFDGLAFKFPVYGLIQARDENLYGVTLPSGGGFIDPNPLPAAVFRASTSGAVTMITNFSQPYNMAPTDGLVEGPDGWLYGTARSSYTMAAGVIYKVSTNGALRVLVTFPAGSLSSASRPYGGLAVGPDGYLYGTVGTGPSPISGEAGTLFRMTTNGVLTTLAQFGGIKGSNPRARLVVGADGNFYGLTSQGGASGNGTIFRFRPSSGIEPLASGFGIYTVDDSGPALCLGKDGNLYGTGRVPSGSLGSGVVFRLVEPPLLRTEALSNQMRFAWNSFSNAVHRIEYKGSISDSNWTSAGATITSTGAIGSASFAFPGVSQRFYRAVLLP